MEKTNEMGVRMTAALATFERLRGDEDQQNTEKDSSYVVLAEVTKDK